MKVGKILVIVALMLMIERVCERVRAMSFFEMVM